MKSEKLVHSLEMASVRHSLEAYREQITEMAEREVRLRDRLQRTRSVAVAFAGLSLLLSSALVAVYSHSKGY